MSLELFLNKFVSESKKISARNVEMCDEFFLKHALPHCKQDFFNRGSFLGCLICSYGTARLAQTKIR